MYTTTALRHFVMQLLYVEHLDELDMVRHSRACRQVFCVPESHVFNIE
jgi:hypothetical protein